MDRHTVCTLYFSNTHSKQRNLWAFNLCVVVGHAFLYVMVVSMRPLFSGPRRGSCSKTQMPGPSWRQGMRRKHAALNGLNLLTMTPHPWLCLSIRRGEVSRLASSLGESAHGYTDDAHRAQSTPMVEGKNSKFTSRKLNRSHCACGAVKVRALPARSVSSSRNARLCATSFSSSTTIRLEIFDKPRDCYSKPQETLVLAMAPRKRAFQSRDVERQNANAHSVALISA